MSTSRRMQGKKYQPPLQFFLFDKIDKQYRFGGYATEMGANQAKGWRCVVKTFEELCQDEEHDSYERQWLLAETGQRETYPKLPPMSPEHQKNLMDWMFPFRLLYPTRVETVPVDLKHLES